MLEEPSSLIEFVTKGLELKHKKDLYEKSVVKSYEKVDSKSELLTRLFNDSVSLTDVDTPDFKYVAARTLLAQLYSEASDRLGGLAKKAETVEEIYSNFPIFVQMMVEKGLYAKDLVEKYTEEELVEISRILDPSKDLFLDYAGLRMLADKYLITSKGSRAWVPTWEELEQKYENVEEIVAELEEKIPMYKELLTSKTMELPQERWLVIAMAIMINEPKNVRIEYIKEFYWALSNLYMTVATPTMSNAGTPDAQLSSCFIDTVGDSLEGIMSNLHDDALVSKFGGGVGVYLGKVRSRGSDIRGFTNIASGVIPWIRLINDVGVSVDQLGQRAGAISPYLDLWHKDIFSFLEIGTNNGDEREKARDVFPGICIPDLFMELVDSDESGRMKTPDAEWHLFDPHEVRTLMGWSLEDCYDEEEGSGTWRTRYQQCIAHPLLSRTTIPVKKLVQAILTAQLETGMPYMFYRDEANRKNPNKHAGMIYCSNLCTEIMQNMSATEYVSRKVVIEDGEELIATYRKPGDYVVCNLSSVNLAKAVQDGVLERLIPIQVRALDNVIDVNNLPLVQATSSNKKNRSIGLGTFGWHHLLAVKGIDWDDERSVQLADEVYEEIAYLAIKSSMELAKEKGEYPLFEGSTWATGEYFDSRGYTTEDSRFDWNGLQLDVMLNGVRNGHIMAVAPNASTAIIAGSTQGIDPFYGAKGIYFEEKKSFKLPIVAPDMSPETFPLYYRRNAHYVSQHMTIRQNAKRQRHIDQAISMNLYVDSEILGKDLMELHREVWRNKIKTSYYVRGTGNMVDDCESCQ